MTKKEKKKSANDRREFSRPYGERRYKKIFVLSAEGETTEPEYFDYFNKQKLNVLVKCQTGKHSSPTHILKQVKDHISKQGLNDSDEAWLVVDKDRWTDEQLTELHKWSLKKDNYHFALSNPKFEYWLLLHFEEGTGIASSQDCDRRLRVHIPGYVKHIDMRKFDRKMIDEAIERARQRDVPPCEDWPRNTGTTVYRLVESILKQE